MEALKCPVCEGKQTVREGFYKTGQPDLTRPKCRSCDGKGYITSPSPAPVFQPYYVPYYVPAPPPWYTTATPVVTWGTTTISGIGQHSDNVAWYSELPQTSGVATTGYLGVLD